MSWPLSQDYNEAIQDPGNSFNDAELKTGEAVSNALGIPMPRSGNFADVYEVRCPSGSRWAVKCFTRQVSGLQERYSEIGKYLHLAKLPFMVDFKYLDQGIRVRGQWYPILKMQWVEGFVLNEFVRDNLDKKPILQGLGLIWSRMAKRLRESYIAHGDLQHGNVMFVPGSSAKSLAVKLIDYDGMCVPSLIGSQSGEVGHPAYQHPERLRSGAYNQEMDRFSLLCIAASLRCLAIGGRSLWDRYDNGDNLLFRQSDLQAPAESPLFKELLAIGDEQARTLVKELHSACQASLDAVPLLTDLMPEEKPTAPAASPSKTPTATKTVTATPTAASAFQGIESEASEKHPRRKPARAAKRSLLPWLVGCGVAACILLTAVIFWASRSPNRPQKASLKLEPRQAHANRIMPTKVATNKNVPPPDENIQPSPNEPPQPKAVSEPKAEPKNEEKTPKTQEKTVQTTPVSKPEDPVGEVRVFKGHTKLVRRVAISPDGRQALSAGFDGTVRLWDIVTGRELVVFKGHTDNVIHGIAFLPDGRRVLSGGKDRLIRLWNAADGKEVRTLKGHTQEIIYLVVSADGRHVLSCGTEPDVILWDLETGDLIHRLGGHVGGVRCVAFSPDGRMGASGTNKGVIHLWDLTTGKELRRLDVQEDIVQNVTFSPDGRQLFAAYWTRPMRLWDVTTGKELRRFDTHSGKLEEAAVSADDRRVVTGGEDKILRLWDVATGKELHRFRGHDDRIWSVALSTDGRYALSGSNDNSMRLWRLPPAPLVAVPPPQREAKPTPSPVPASSHVVHRLPIPDKAVQDKATSDIRDIYKPDYASKQPADRLVLAAKLLKRGANDKEDPGRRYVYLREARDQAARYGDVALSFRAIDAMNEAYAVEPLPMKTAALERAVKALRNADLANKLLSQALTVANEAEVADDYEQASKLLRIAQSAALKSGDRSLPGMVNRLQSRLKRLQTSYAKIADAVKTLADKPDDAEANLAVGKFRCFDKEEWKKGLPMLAKSGDAMLADLANKDISNPKEAAEQAVLGQSWLTFTDKQSESRIRSATKRRGKHWLRAALPSLKGADADRVSAQLEIKIGKLRLRPGLVAELFAGENFEKKIKTRLDYKVDYDWGLQAPDDGVPVDHFSIRWQGVLLPPHAGKYKLILQYDDGARLKLDGKNVIDKWGGPFGTAAVDVVLTAQPHMLQLECHEGIVGAVMRLHWSQDGGFPKQPIPLEALYHDIRQERLLAP